MKTIAIVGRPNVGKSLLFNKLTGRRLSIVEDTPGVTRDRLYSTCEWRGETIRLIDTGGIEPHTNDDIFLFMRQQAEIAIDMADVIILVCDIKTGVTAADADVAAMLLKSKKPVVAAVNKVDGIGPPPAELYEFYNLGFGEPIAISALHGHGTGDLLDACFGLFAELNIPEIEADEDAIKVAIIGKPNAGKSSLLNNILGVERVIVSETAGTTRDSVDTEFENEHGKFILTDTAGMRRKSKVLDGIEYYSVLRAVSAVERSDVCVVLIDALEGVVEQDTKIAGIAHESGKPSIIAVNKWDILPDKDEHSTKKAMEKIRAKLAYMPYAPIVCLSAKTGQRVDRLFPLIIEGFRQSKRRITTGQLNAFLAEAVSRVQPPTDRGKRLKIYYITQVGDSPPHFVCFCNNSELFHYSYKRYLENQIREVFAITGTPIRMTIRERGEG